MLHISDLHFGTRGVEQMADVVHEAAERIAPDAVIASGDLVEWAEKPSAWRGVAAFLSRFRPPVLTVPGNHDIERVNVFSRFARPFRAYRRHVHEQLDRAVSIGGAHLVGMCSPSRITLDLGYVSRQQIEWAADSFAGADQAALRVLVVHHGVRPLRRRLFRNHLRGRKLEKPLLARGVDLVLTGHRHFPYAEQLTGPSGGQLLWSQAGTATCARLHPGQRANSFSVIQADREQIEVTWWHYQADRRGFEPGESLSFQRRRRAELPAPAGLLPEPV